MWLATVLFSLFMPWLMLAAVYAQNVFTLLLQRGCLKGRPEAQQTRVSGSGGSFSNSGLEERVISADSNERATTTLR